MKLIQLNIWQGKILLAATKFLKEQDADIICMQEVYSLPGEKAFVLLDMLSTLEGLQAELDYPYVYYEPTCGFTVAGDKAMFGNAIFSKYPLENRQTLFTNGEYYEIDDWKTQHLPNVRNAMICTVNAPDGAFNLVTHHGYHEFNPVGSELTVAAMQKLVDVMKSLQGPIVFAGDLNVTAASPTMRLFDNWLEDLTATHNVTDTLTEFGKVRGVPCDHILISPEVQVKEFTVSPALVSDHTPLILEFSL